MVRTDTGIVFEEGVCIFVIVPGRLVRYCSGEVKGLEGSIVNGRNDFGFVACWCSTLMESYDLLISSSHEVVG